MENPLTPGDFNCNVQRKEEQPAAILIDPEEDQEVQCDGGNDDGSIGHEHRDSMTSGDLAWDHEAFITGYFWTKTSKNEFF